MTVIKNLKSQSGFTLIEIVLSIALLTTIIMITTNLLSSELKLRQNIISRYPFDRIIARISEDISGAFTILEDPTNKQINFVYSNANNGSLLFSVVNYLSLIADTKESNIARIGYIIENNEDKKQLVRIVDTKMDDWKYIPQSGVGTRSVLVDNIKELTFSFWKNEKFVDEWDSTSNEAGKMPKMVKINLTLYLPNNGQKPATQSNELALEEIVYVRNANYKPSADDLEPEDYSWQ